MRAAVRAVRAIAMPATKHHSAPGNAARYCSGTSWARATRPAITALNHASLRPTDSWVRPAQATAPADRPTPAHTQPIVLRMPTLESTVSGSVLLACSSCQYSSVLMPPPTRHSPAARSRPTRARVGARLPTGSCSSSRRRRPAPNAASPRAATDMSTWNSHTDAPLSAMSGTYSALSASAESGTSVRAPEAKNPARPASPARIPARAQARRGEAGLGAAAAAAACPGRGFGNVVGAAAPDVVVAACAADREVVRSITPPRSRRPCRGRRGDRLSRRCRPGSCRWRCTRPVRGRPAAPTRRPPRRRRRRRPS